MKDTKAQAEACLKRFKSLKKSRANWEEHWRDVARYVIPNKENVHDFKSRSTGDKKRLQLYDSSAAHYNELLASALHSMLTNPSVQWFELTSGDHEVDKNQDVQEYLQAVVRKIHQVLNNTNFQTEIHEVYLDLGSFGTGAMLIEEDDENVLNFSSRPIYQFFIEENFKHEVDTFFIELKYNSRQLLQKYGEEALGEDLCKLCKKKPEDNHIVIMEVSPNSDYDESKKLEAAKSKPYKSIHVHEKSQMVVKEGGFDEFPAVFPRWIKDSMETYGRSPGMKSLPEIKMINAMMRTIIRAAQKMVDPPLMVPDDSFLNFNTKPGGLNPYRSGTQDKVYPIEIRGQIGIGLEILKDTRDRIKESFFIDQLQLREGPQMTATEVNARTDEHLRLLGPILGRMHFELLQPLIVRIIGIMMRKGELPEKVPKELEGRTPQVFYSSQIAKAQRVSEGQNWNRFLGSIAGLAEGKPEIMDNIDSDGVVNYLAGIYGAPTETLKKPKDVKKTRDDRAKQQQAEQQALMEQEQAKTAEISSKAASNQQ